VESARRLGYFAAVTVLATVPYRVMAQAKGLTFEGDPWTPMVSRILSTSWGHAAVWQAAAALIAAGGFLMAGRGKPHGWMHSAIGAAVLAIVPALMGHAIAAEPAFWSVGADLMHVTAAGAWAGGLAMLTFAALQLRGAPDSGETVASLIERFHPVAKRAVGVLVLTGVIGGKYHIRAWADLANTPYGQVLLAKVALVVVALVLGWRHSRIGARRTRASGAEAITASLVTEWVVMTGVLLVTGLLTGSPPPGTE
jgi:putative copper export protein